MPGRLGMWRAYPGHAPTCPGAEVGRQGGINATEGDDG